MAIAPARESRFLLAGAGHAAAHAYVLPSPTPWLRPLTIAAAAVGGLLRWPHLDRDHRLRLSACISTVALVYGFPPVDGLLPLLRAHLLHVLRPLPHP